MEIIVFNNKLSLANTSSNTLKIGNKYSDEEQLSQKKNKSQYGMI